MRTADFEYPLPPELIAQKPAAARDQSRLLVFERATAGITHRAFTDLLSYIRPGDLLVLNDSKVIPARLRGVNSRSGGRFEIMLVEENGVNDWWAMMRPGKRARLGTVIQLRGPSDEQTQISAIVREINPEGHRRLTFSGTPNLVESLDALGETPLPPYIERTRPQAEDLGRYQTVYARKAGSVAAPTAGLHFTPEILDKIRSLDAGVCFLTLHVGLGTFAPVKALDINEHVMHEERFEISAETAAAVNTTIQNGGRIIAVGTTSVRVLESVAREHRGRVVPGAGKTNIFIYPPYNFQVVNALVTNFHLPSSTLLMLVSAFATPGKTDGIKQVLGAYREAVRERYRFFSYGDAMLLI